MRHRLVLSERLITLDPATASLEVLSRLAEFCLPLLKGSCTDLVVEGFVRGVSVPLPAEACLCLAGVGLSVLLPLLSLFLVLLLRDVLSVSLDLPEFMMSKAVMKSSSSSAWVAPPDEPGWLPSLVLSLLIALHSVTVLGSPCLLGLGLKDWHLSFELPGEVTFMSLI